MVGVGVGVPLFLFTAKYCSISHAALCLLAEETLHCFYFLAVMENAVLAPGSVGCILLCLFISVLAYFYLTYSFLFSPIECNLQEGHDLFQLVQCCVPRASCHAWPTVDNKRLLNEQIRASCCHSPVFLVDSILASALQPWVSFPSDFSLAVLLITASEHNQVLLIQGLCCSSTDPDLNLSTQSVHGVGFQKHLSWAPALEFLILWFRCI